MAAQLVSVALALLCCAAAQEQPSPEEALKGLLDSTYLARRVSTADTQQADREALMNRAALMARTLRSQPSAKYMGGAEQGGYIDLARLPKEIQPPSYLTRSVQATDSNYPRMPTAEKPPPPQLFIKCPESYSVKQFGAVGNGAASDAVAILTASRSLDYLYFPPGTYRIAGSIAIDKPIIVGKGAVLSVDGGSTLTLTKRPQHWDKTTGMFAGTGRVVLAGDAEEIIPDWFKRPGWGDTQILQTATDSCGGSCTIILTRQYILGQAWYLRPNVGVFSVFPATILGLGGSGEGVVLLPGKYSRVIHFSTIFQFSKFAVKIQGGVTGAEIQLSTVIDGGDAVLFHTDEGAGGVISNVFVTHFSATRDMQSTATFRGSSPNNRLENCLVAGNFVLMGGAANPAQQSAALTIAGAAPVQLVATSVIYQAIDPFQSSTLPTQFVFLENTLPAPADNVVFIVDAWGGAIWGAGKTVAGTFSNLKFLCRMAGGIPGPENLYPTLRLAGGTNIVTWGAVSSAGTERKLLATGTTISQAAFGPVVQDQVFYANAPITSRWLPGEERTYYFYNVYAATAPNTRCVAFRAFNLGIVCTKAVSQHDQEPYRIAVTLQNTARYTLIPAWMPAHRFGVQVGPW